MECRYYCKAEAQFHHVSNKYCADRVLDLTIALPNLILKTRINSSYKIFVPKRKKKIQLFKLKQMLSRSGFGTEPHAPLTSLAELVLEQNQSAHSI